MIYERNLYLNNMHMKTVRRILTLIILSLLFVSSVFFVSYGVDNTDPYCENSVSQSKTEPIENTEIDTNTSTGVVNKNGNLYYFIDGSMQYNRWIYSGGLWFYAKSDGELYKNTIVRIGSEDYAFDSKGVMYCGNFIFNNAAYLTDENGHILKSGWKQYSGKWYYAQSNGVLYSDTVKYIGNSQFGFDCYGVMYSNHFKYNGKYYLPDADGYIWRNGWKYRDGTWYFSRNDGSLYTDGIFDINGEKYGFSYDGKMQTNAFSIGDKHYCADSSGAVFSQGWQYIESSWYYVLRNGSLATDGVYKISGEYYCFNDAGKMYVNAFSHKNKRYITNSSGALYVNTWKRIDGKWYYAQADGSLCADGIFRIGNDSFAFYDDGAMCEGEFLLNNKRYVADDMGVVQKNGWKVLKSKKYYARSDGSLYANEIAKIGNNHYGFDYKGVLQTNEFALNGNKYLAKENGELHTRDWLYYKGYWYYAKPDSSLYCDGFYDIKDEKFVFDANGKMLCGEFEYNNKRYVTNVRGDVQRSGWNKVNNIWYYATSDFSLYANVIKNIDGEDYGFDSKGRMYDGLFTLNDKHYATSSSGAILKNGWRQFGSDEWVLPDSQGVLLVSDWYKYCGRYYYAKQNGVFARSESLNINGTTYYFDSTCANISKEEYDEIERSKSNVINIARKEVGTKVGEKYWNATFNGSPRYVNGDATPWCGCFVNWCFKEAGQSNKLSGLGNKAYVPSYVNWAKNNGTWNSSPQPGDLIVFRWSSSSNGSHIGFVESVNGNTITTIEGNTGYSYHGEVKRNYFNKNSSYIYGFIHL